MAGGKMIAAGLYGMADAGWGDPVALGQMLVLAGCKTIQLRAKDWSEQDIANAASTLIPMAHERGAKLIINDHLDVALKVGADGVHIGQDDGNPQEIRERLGDGKILGISTHTLPQVNAAQPVADYIGFGPVFATQSKKTGYTPRGIEALRHVISISSVPVVAIGGINAANIDAVTQTGVHAWAVIGAIASAESPSDAIAAFLGAGL